MLCLVRMYNVWSFQTVFSHFVCIITNSNREREIDKILPSTGLLYTTKCDIRGFRLRANYDNRN